MNSGLLCRSVYNEGRRTALITTTVLRRNTETNRRIQLPLRSCQPFTQSSTRSSAQKLGKNKTTTQKHSQKERKKDRKRLTQTTNNLLQQRFLKRVIGGGRLASGIKRCWYSLFYFFSSVAAFASAVLVRSLLRARRFYSDRKRWPGSFAINCAPKRSTGRSTINQTASKPNRRRRG